MRLLLPVALACVCSLAPELASAQEKVAVASPVAAPAKARTKRARARLDPRKKHGKHGPGSAVVTFPGFRMLDGGASRVFVEVSKKVDIVESKTPARVSYRIKGAYAPTRTNRLPLITDFFRTPVGRVQLVEDGEDLELVIDLREPSEVEHRLVESEGGVVLQVDFSRTTRVEAAPAEATDGAVKEKAPAKRTTETTRIGGGAFGDPSL